jgi:hypothetical protein
MQRLHAGGTSTGRTDVGIRLAMMRVGVMPKARDSVGRDLGFLLTVAVLRLHIAFMLAQILYYRHKSDHNLRPSID